MTHVYMVAHFNDGGHYIDVMTKGEVDAIRKRSKSPEYGPWSTDYEAMAMKSVIRRAFKFMPVSVEAAEGAAADETVQIVNESEGEPIIAMPESVEDAVVVDVETGEVIEENDESKENSNE